jgi:hypothetical protein
LGRCSLRRGCASMKRTGEKTSCSARNESAAPAVAIVGKQSPYNPGEM